MRDSIARTLMRVLSLLLPARGKRRAIPVLAPAARPAICGPTTPIPAHVLARSIPSAWHHRVGPWLLAREAEREAERTLDLFAVPDRWRALECAASGTEHPYTYEGAPFPARAFAAAAGVSA